MGHIGHRPCAGHGPAGRMLVRALALGRVVGTQARRLTPVSLGRCETAAASERSRLEYQRPCAINSMRCAASREPKLDALAYHSRASAASAATPSTPIF